MCASGCLELEDKAREPLSDTPSSIPPARHVLCTEISMASQIIFNAKHPDDVETDTERSGLALVCGAVNLSWQVGL